MRSTSGISVSVCQTVTGAWPEILVSAAIMSRSRLRPGRRTTADFMAGLSGECYGIILDHRIRQQLLAHGFQVGFSLGLVGAVQHHVEDLALAHRADAGKAERAERALDCLALRVEHAGLESNGYAGLDHGLSFPGLWMSEKRE